VFNFISESEAGAAYVYLLAYPPQLEVTSPNSHAPTDAKH